MFGQLCRTPSSGHWDCILLRPDVARQHHPAERSWRSLGGVQPEEHHDHRVLSANSRAEEELRKESLVSACELLGGKQFGDGR